jgi:succinyl-diaminopimelate desuccinylase
MAVIMASRLLTGTETALAPYFTDASALTPALGAVPTVILGPGPAALAHQTDEWCDIARIDEAVDIYRRLVAQWCF